jgi:hypothetical protein
MRLSEAIRLGAMLKPQGREQLLTHAGRSCALGAALDACGQLRGEQATWPNSPLYATAAALWPILDVMASAPRDADLLRDRLKYLITQLNDERRWTREQIADWVESIEAQHESPGVREAQFDGTHDITFTHCRMVSDGEILNTRE